MQKPFWAIALLLLAETALAQTTASPSFESFNRQRGRLLKNTSLFLGGWAVANMASGAVGMAVAEGEARHFHTMNLGWNTVNLALAVPGYLKGRKHVANSRYDYGDLEEQMRMEKILLVNAGIDLAYIMGGVYLIESAKNKSPDDAARFRGWGKSVVFQGGFLLVYDAVATHLHARNRRQHEPLFRGLTVAPSPQGAGLALVWVR